MAQFMAKIVADSKNPDGSICKGTIRQDKRERVIAHARDLATGQYLTVYPQIGSGIDLTKLQPGMTVVFEGTVHPLYENVKMIADSVEVVKTK